MAVHQILANPAYKLAYWYRHSEHELVSIPMPAIVDDSTWQADQAQLAENSRYSRRNNQRQRYFLMNQIVDERDE